MSYKENSPAESPEEIRRRIIGFGEDSFKKSYYPQLQYKQDELRRFRIALDSTSDLVFILDYPSFNIIDTNSRAEEVLGYTKKEFVGMNLNSLTDESSAECFGNLSLLSEDSSVLCKADIISKKGIITPMEVSISLAELGKDTFAAAVCRDITERERLLRTIRESELQYRITINSLKDIVVVINSSLDIVISNNSFEKLCKKRYPGGALEVKNIKKLFKHFYWEKNKNFDSLPDYLNFFEINMKYKFGGNLAIYSVRNMPIFENGVFKLSVFYMRDITEFTIMDEMKKDAFLQIDKNMEQFAVLNDHIRNPLQVILGIVDLECPQAVDKIMPYVTEIDKIINRLDNGWIESEKIRKMIAKHYGVSIIDDSDVGDAINYLKKISEV